METKPILTDILGVSAADSSLARRAADLICYDLFRVVVPGLASLTALNRQELHRGQVHSAASQIAAIIQSELDRK